jgi:hypothetical protein
LSDVFRRVSNATDAVEKGLFTIKTADLMHALKTLRMLKACFMRRLNTDKP